MLPPAAYNRRQDQYTEKTRSLHQTKKAEREISLVDTFRVKKFVGVGFLFFENPGALDEIEKITIS